MQAAKVDVLIPAYNAERTLVSAIRSIQDQTVQDIRLIVVDDGSTDRTGDLLREVAAADPRIVVIDTPNGGIVAALNLALDQATAPFIARHDADDLAFTDRFARQLDYLERHPDCIAVGGDAFHVDDRSRRTGWTTHFAGDVDPHPDLIPAVEPYLMHPFLMVRRDAIVGVGGYRYALNSEDTDLYWRLVGRGRLHTLPGPMGEYRVHAGSISSASVHSGRLAAVYAELGALSFRRRRAGQPDLSFPRRAVEETRSLGSLEELLAYVGEPLSTEEEEHLRLAVAAKLLQNATYRPYLLDVSDCRTIAAAWPGLRARLTPAERASLDRTRVNVMWRLLRGGRTQALRVLRQSWRDDVRLAIIAGGQLTGRLRRLVRMPRASADEAN